MKGAKEKKAGGKGAGKARVQSSTGKKAKPSTGSATTAIGGATSKKSKGSSEKIWKTAPIGGKKRKASAVGAGAVPVIPAPTDAVSSNWKALSRTLPKSSGKKRRVDGRITLDGGKDTTTTDSPGATREGVDAHSGRAGKGPASTKPNEIWFDGVSEEDLARTLGPSAVIGESEEGGGAETPEEHERRRARVLVPGTFVGTTKHVSMDCEMVGTGATGKASIVARCSIVNMYGHVLYDSFVKAQERVTDYRTHVSGVRPTNLKSAPTFQEMQKEVSKLLKGKILVGHALKNDFRVLLLNHPKRDIRDTSRYRPLRNKYAGGGPPGLKKLSKELLGIDIQKGEHSSVTDAQATMAVYLKVRKEWESGIREKKKGAMTGKTNAPPTAL